MGEKLPCTRRFESYQAEKTFVILPVLQLCFGVIEPRHVFLLETAGTLRMGDPTALDDGSSARIEVNADLMRIRDSLRTIDLAERSA